MPSARRMILGHVLAGFCHKMNRKKPINDDMTGPSLKRCLTTFDITLMGVGNMVGAGIYVLTGSVARNVAGPSTVISFLIAAVISTLAALCYAEFGTRIPRAGSAYAYTYVSVGEFWAFVIGWNIVLEYMIGAASIARAWSGNLDSMFNGSISNTTIYVTGELHEALLSRHPDVLAFAICIVASMVLAIGVKTSAYINNALTILNLFVISLVIVIGFYYADITNWTDVKGGFMPYGIAGVMGGAATCFYAFVGFDSIASSSEEAKDPTTSIPSATILSMCIVAIGYVLVVLALTLMIPYTDINPEAALSSALGSVHADWAKYIVGIGAVCGMTTSLLGSLFALPRCLYAMSADGLLFGFLSDLTNKSSIPVITLIVSGLSSALIALLFDLEKLVEFMSIGTLLAYTIVSASVIVLRYRPAASDVETSGSPHAETPSDREDSSGTGSPATDTLSLTSEMYEVLRVGRLRAQFSWLEPLVGGCAPGAAVSVAVSVYAACCALALVLLKFAVNCADVGPGDDVTLHALWTMSPIAVLVLIMVLCIVVIMAHEQSEARVPFRVPFVPVVPALSVLLNMYLMTQLRALTWARFAVWMTIGFLLYFLYGIHHSRQDEDATAGLLRKDRSRSGSGGAGGTRWGASDTARALGRRLASLTRVAKPNKYADGDAKPIIGQDELAKREA